MVELYDLGERPPLGVVPQKMHAFAVRQNRFGQPRDAWKREVLPTPQIKDDEVLIYVMAIETDVEAQAKLVNIV
jgi:crotonyl-CoA carboxylase/reductase